MTIFGEIKYTFLLSSYNYMTILNAIHKAVPPGLIKSESVTNDGGFIRLVVKVHMSTPAEALTSAVKTFPGLKEAINYKRVEKKDQ